LPRLDELFRKYAEERLSVIVINFEGPREKTQKFINENNLTIPFLEDVGAEMTQNVFQAGPFSYTYIVDDQGRILYIHGTFREGDEKKIEEKIKLLLGE
jgi:peroxiredoxin